MSNRKLIAAAGIALTSALALTACTPPTPGANSSANAATSINVSWNQAFYSYNNSTDYGNAVANTNPVYMSNDRIAYYDKDLKIAQNPSFGKYEKVSDSPLKVKITFADTATWSDGTPVTAADAILKWASASGNYNTTKSEQDDDGNVAANTGNDVYFNSSDPGFALIKDFPQYYGYFRTKEFMLGSQRVGPGIKFLDLYSPYADGLKTGHTAEAGYCFLGSATRDGRRLIMVVAGPAAQGRSAQNQGQTEGGKGFFHCSGV